MRLGLQVRVFSKYPQIIENNAKSGWLVRFNTLSNSDTTDETVFNGKSSFSFSTRGKAEDDDAIVRCAQCTSMRVFVLFPTC